jgi:DNA end-binding protein Ku
VLLLEAMKDSEMGAIGRFVLRGAEYFALIRPKGEALVLETLFLAEDVRSQAEIEEAVAGTEVKKAELDLAQQVMQSLVGEFDPSELVSQYRSDLRQMLEAKLDGKEIAKPEPVPEAPVVDLLEALKKSVAEAKERKTPSASSSKTKAASKSGSRTRRAPARKSA